MLSVFGRFNERGGGGGGAGGALRFWPVQRAGGAVRFRPVQRAGEGGVLSAYDCVREKK